MKKQDIPFEVASPLSLVPTESGEGFTIENTKTGYVFATISKEQMMMKNPSEGDEDHIISYKPLSRIYNVQLSESDPSVIEVCTRTGADGLPGSAGLYYHKGNSQHKTQEINVSDCISLYKAKDPDTISKLFRM